MTKVLMDTNVWLDCYLPNRKHGPIARELLKRCAGNEDKIDILIPLHTLNDVFCQVSREAKQWVRKSTGSLSEAYAHAANGQAWDCIDRMLKIGAPVGADMSDVWLACHLREINPDFEDDMVLAAAERAQADFLVTSDEQLIRKATVAALTPEDMLKVLLIRSAS